MTTQGDQLANLTRLSEAAREQVIALTEKICLVPAPSYEEQERANLVAGEFSRLGLESEIDEIGNVYARRPGAGTKKGLLLVAHTDTVFPRNTPISVERKNGRLMGPSIGDNSLGVAAMLELVTLLNDAGIETPGDLILVANVGEEGLGNLRGVRAAVDRLESEIGGVIAIEGHNLGRITHIAVGSHRIRVTVDGPGGHSWGAFGQPSAIHALGRIIAAIADLEVPADPKTTFNVGVIEGGVSVNTIAPKASAIIDMRSVDKAELDKLVQQVESIVNAENTDNVRTAIEVLGERPAGRTPVDSRIVQTGINVLKTMGIEAELNASSTDANIPISRGIPAICIGLTRGEGAHRIEEWIETEPISKGMLQLALLVSEFPVD